jgi:hypothetical protein
MSSSDSVFIDYPDSYDQVYYLVIGTEEAKETKEK